MAGAQVRADHWVHEYITPYDAYLHGITRVLAYRRTRYQDMSIVETGAYGKALVLDGKWQSCTGDEFLYHEPLVHPAMLHHGSPRRVLILGGGEGATAREVLRWRCVEKVAMVDIDGDVVDACREYLPEMHRGAFDDPRLELIIDDALNVLARGDARWDVVISDLTDPIEDGPSFKFFTREYFAKVRGVLNEGGAFVLQSGPVAPIDTTAHARLFRTVTDVFAHAASGMTYAPTYGQPWSFIVASNAPIDTMPCPDAVDEILASKTGGGFRMFDGKALLGLYQIPLHLRRALAKETRVYSLAEPPRFFGKSEVQPGVAAR